MANKAYDEFAIQAIANAIRAKNGQTDTYTVAQMAGAIEAIESGGGSDDALKWVLENGSGDYILPSNITSIGSSAFCNCSDLKLTSLPSGIDITTKRHYEHWVLCFLQLFKTCIDITTKRHYEHWVQCFFQLFRSYRN